MFNIVAQLGKQKPTKVNFFLGIAERTMLLPKVEVEARLPMRLKIRRMG